MVAAAASPAGDVLTAAVAVSDTVLYLSDLGNDFNESGGLLLLAGSVLAYVSADDEAATVTLAAGAPAAVDAGEPVIAWDDLTGTPVYDTTADVELDDGEVVTAEVPHELSALIVESLRTGGGEAVEVAPDGDAWTVLNVIGKRPTIDAGYVVGRSITLARETDSAGIPSGTTLTSLTGMVTGAVVGKPLPDPDGDGWVLIASTGLYLMIATAAWAADPNGVRRTVIQRKDAAGTVTNIRSVVIAPTADTNYTVQTIATTPLSAGEWVRGAVSQTSGSPLALRGDSDRSLTAFEVIRLAV